MSNQEAVQHFQQAESFKAQGRLAEAAASYQSALQYDPHAVQLWWALGDIHAQMENFPGVEACCREIIARNPTIAEVHLYLGMALQRQERLAEAESALQMTLQLNPGLAEGRYQLAIVQQAQGLDAEAIENYRQALGAIQDRAPALYNLSILYQRLGRSEEAYTHAFAALQAAPATLKYRQQFVKLLNASCPSEVQPEVMAEVLRCFDTRGIDTEPLVKPCMRLLAADPLVQRAILHARQMSLEQFGAEVAQGEFDALFTNPLLIKLLLHTKVPSPEFEALMCVLRRLALADVMSGAGGNSIGTLAANRQFIEAMASQFFNTDYAAFVTPQEVADVDALASRLRGQTSQPFDAEYARRMAIFCMYRPLPSLEGIDALLGDAEATMRAMLPQIVERQWKERRTELALRANIESLTPIDAGISAAVREQYEDSPYPRWFSVDLYPSVSCRESLREQFPHFQAPDFGPAPLDILVAGCGTGRHAIMVATHYAHSQVLAVDLSRTSLAYAKRKADEAGVTNVRFAQADILKLGSLAQRFHIIESVGVLHHLQAPQAGLKVLTDLLVDRGLMRLGFYSAYGRRAVTAARQYIAEQGFECTPEGMRAARQAILALDSRHPAYPVTRFRDFYTLSECRDLLFHVQEHCLRIPELASLLDGCGLEFIGFTFANIQVLREYKECYPDDPAATNLSNWDAFEQAHPDIFEEMYQFWCQKA